MAHVRENRNAFTFRWENMRLFLRPRCEDNIKKDFKGILWEGVDWTNLASQMDIWQVVLNRVTTIRYP